MFLPLCFVVICYVWYKVEKGGGIEKIKKRNRRKRSDEDPRLFLVGVIDLTLQEGMIEILQATFQGRDNRDF